MLLSRFFLILAIAACSKDIALNTQSRNVDSVVRVGGDLTPAILAPANPRAVAASKDCFIINNSASLKFGDLNSQISNLAIGTEIIYFPSSPPNPYESASDIYAFDGTLWRNSMGATEEEVSEIILPQYLMLRSPRNLSVTMNLAGVSSFEYVSCTSINPWIRPWANKLKATLPENKDCYFESFGDPSLKFSDLSLIENIVPSMGVTTPTLTLHSFESQAFPLNLSLSSRTVGYFDIASEDGDWLDLSDLSALDTFAVPKRFVLRTLGQGGDIVFDPQEKVHFMGCSEMSAPYSRYAFSLSISGNTRPGFDYFFKSSNETNNTLSQIEFSNGFKSTSLLQEGRRAEVLSFSQSISAKPGASMQADKVYFVDSAGLWREDSEGTPVVSDRTLLSKYFIIRSYANSDSELSIARTPLFEYLGAIEHAQSPRAWD